MRIEVALDTGNSTVVPTITVSDADAPSKAEHAADPVDDTPTPVGGMPTGPAPAIPDWYKVGWRQVSGIDAAPLSEGEEKDKGVLDLFLAEQFYGDWYHSAALIIFVRVHLSKQCHDSYPWRRLSLLPIL